MSEQGNEKRTQPPWKCSGDEPQLKLFNSLTRKKEIFVPRSGNEIQWYCCGPTVYDASHMGHARSYISFDILRRVLVHYFRYDVHYVMNVTDIDDKIIKRARQNHLMHQYVEKNLSLPDVIGDVKSSLLLWEEKLRGTTDEDKKQLLERTKVKIEDALSNAENTMQSETSDRTVDAKKNLLEDAKDVLGEWLDVHHCSEVNDNTIFSSLPQYWEDKFFEDMRALNVLAPDTITKVSEFVPEIIEYIKKIIDNGMAYTSNGSVYFDTIKFDKSPDHFYCKLVPEAFGDIRMLHEGEGDLSISEDRLSEKKSTSDFALWKASKPGEPSWDSPWGKGRPGWHIECSVMASNLLGDSLDIHSGGCDLKFPHHDNELAQAEAYFGNDEWVRYFLHSGHLTISGCKMSKSLKNFITIKEALQTYSAQQLRFAFLLHSWKDTLDYSTKTMEMAIQYERMLSEFFLNLKDAIRFSSKGETQKYPQYGKDDLQLKALRLKFREKKQEVHAALCDNIDTRTALNHIRDLVRACNVYITDKIASANHRSAVLLKDVGIYVAEVLKAFGVIELYRSSGFSEERSAAASGNVEEIAMPFVEALSEFREKIREFAVDIKATKLLEMCDDIRDEVLPKLGVRLEDLPGQTSIKFVDSETLLKEKEMKLKMEEEKRRIKELKKQQQEAAEAAKNARNKIPPWEMFKLETNKYSKFDEKGIPTHDIEGKELSKGQLKKLLKSFQLQEKKYNEYQNRLLNNSENGVEVQQ